MQPRRRRSPPAHRRRPLTHTRPTLPPALHNREERDYDREAVLGRDAASVFPTESRRAAMAGGEALAELLGGGNRKFISETVGWVGGGWELEGVDGWMQLDTALCAQEGWAFSHTSAPPCPPATLQLEEIKSARGGGGLSMADGSVMAEKPLAEVRRCRRCSGGTGLLAWPFRLPAPLPAVVLAAAAAALTLTLTLPPSAALSHRCCGRPRTPRKPSSRRSGRR